jgi:hypothetical protein
VTTLPASPTTTSKPVSAPTVTPPPVWTGPVANYKAGEFCPKADIGETVATPEGSLTCKVTTSPEHPHWEHR